LLRVAARSCVLNSDSFVIGPLILSIGPVQLDGLPLILGLIYPYTKFAKHVSIQPVDKSMGRTARPALAFTVACNRMPSGV
jgi:hypothetical protein